MLVHETVKAPVLPRYFPRNSNTRVITAWDDSKNTIRSIAGWGTLLASAADGLLDSVLWSKEREIAI